MKKFEFYAISIQRKKPPFFSRLLFASLKPAPHRVGTIPAKFLTYENGETFIVCS